MNEARREAEDNFRAEKEKIQGFTKRMVIPQIVNLVVENAGSLIDAANQDFQATRRACQTGGDRGVNLYVTRRNAFVAAEESAFVHDAAQ